MGKMGKINESKTKIWIMLSMFCLIFYSVYVGVAVTQEVYRSSQHDFQLIEIATGLEFPWSLAFLPNGNALVTERDRKKLRLVRGGRLVRQAVAGLPDNIQTSGQGGLLDVAVHPNFRQNQWIYLAYSGTGKGGRGTEVIRGKLNGRLLRDVETIFVAEPKTPGRLHYGSRMLFARDGTLFITIGDRYNYRDEAQNLSNHLGSVIRLRDDGSIPLDNPFVGKAGFRQEIYSYGHRNSQGLALRPLNGEIWMHEHGPRGGDELNLLNKPGANYGWPVITYGIDYSGAIISDETHKEGMEQPVVQWTPSIAPSGMTFYDGDKFPSWRDNIFVGTLAGSHIRRLVLSGSKVVEQESLLKGHGRIRDITNGPDGYLYVLIDDVDGKILRLEPQN